MTPNAIEILIHYYVSPDPHPRLSARAVQEEIDSLLRNGLIEPVPDKSGCYRTTMRGSLHVHQLCKTPWPVQAWVGADGEVLGFDAET